MKKLFASILSAALLLSLTACGGSGTTTPASESAKASTGGAPTESASAAKSGGERVEITMSNWLEAEEATAGIFKELLEGFMSANPDIVVKSQAIPFNQYKDQVLIAGTNQNAADVVMGNSQMMGAFNGADILAVTGDYMPKEVLDDIQPGYLSGTTFDGAVKAISWAPHPLAMYYNTELFTKAGLDPAKAPSTWDEMTQAAQKIAALGKDDAGNQIYGLGIPSGKVAHTGTVFNGILYAFGGHFLNEQGKVDLDNAKNLDAMNWLKTLCDEKVNPAGLEIKDLRGLFAAGQIGIIFDGDMGRGAYRKSSGLGADFDKKMGVAIIPTGATGKSETVFTEHQLAISKNSKHPEAAAKLIDYLIGKEAMLKYHKSNAVLSARKSIAALPEMNEDDFMKVFNKQSESARPLPAANPMFDNGMNELTKAIERVVVNHEDPQTVLKETQAAIQSLYGQ